MCFDISLVHTWTLEPTHLDICTISCDLSKFGQKILENPKSRFKLNQFFKILRMMQPHISVVIIFPLKYIYRASNRILSHPNWSYMELILIFQRLHNKFGKIGPKGENKSKVQNK